MMKKDKPIHVLSLDGTTRTLRAHHGETESQETYSPAPTARVSTNPREFADVWSTNMQHVIATIKRPNPCPHLMENQEKSSLASFSWLLRSQPS